MHYLLSIYQPEGEPPPPEVLDPIMERLAALNEQMQNAGSGYSPEGCTHPAPPRSCARPATMY